MSLRQLITVAAGLALAGMAAGCESEDRWYAAKRAAITAGISGACPAGVQETTQTEDRLGWGEWIVTCRDGSVDTVRVDYP